MLGEKPFIHAMKTPLCNYIYDVNTNMFLDVDEDTYQYLKKVEQSDEGVVPIADKRIKQNFEILFSQGYLSSKHPKQIRQSQSDFMEYHLNENIAQMALQVTQQCNFRCAYCAYCASDFEFQREHSSKRMPIETALTAIDFFAARCANQEEPVIAFYGGEPLLEFPLIQQVVAYAREKLYGKNLKFTITTNASLLSPNIARFLLENDFITVISLDGTAETHDRSRRFASNGRGSFSVIRQNLEKIKKQCPEFEFSFNIVVDPRYPCDSLHEMFSKDELFREAQLMSTLIDDQFSIEKTIPDEVFIQQDSQYTFKSYLNFRGAYPRECVSNIAYTSLNAGFSRIKTDMRPKTSLADISAPGGPCITGERRLLVSVDGNLYPCERVSESSEAMNIGNLWDGFDLKKVDKILNVAQTTAEDCKKCWAFRHCTLCGKHSDNCGELSADLRRSYCDSVRAQVEDMFRDYLWMKEFDVFEGI